MNTHARWIPLVLLAAAWALASGASHAFTDDNADIADLRAEQRAAQRDRGVRVVVTGKAGIPRRTVWVPPSAKAIDRFSPVLPAEVERVDPAGSQRLASAAPASAPARR